MVLKILGCLFCRTSGMNLICHRSESTIVDHSSGDIRVTWFIVSSWEVLKVPSLKSVRPRASGQRWSSVSFAKVYRSHMNRRNNQRSRLQDRAEATWVSRGEQSQRVCPDVLTCHMIDLVLFDNFQLEGFALLTTTISEWLLIYCSWCYRWDSCFTGPDGICVSLRLTDPASLANQAIQPFCGSSLARANEQVAICHGRMTGHDFIFLVVWTVVIGWHNRTILS